MNDRPSPVQDASAHVKTFLTTSYNHLALVSNYTRPMYTSPYTIDPFCAIFLLPSYTWTQTFLQCSLSCIHLIIFFYIKKTKKIKKNQEKKQTKKNN